MWWFTWAVLLGMAFVFKERNMALRTVNKARGREDAVPQIEIPPQSAIYLTPSAGIPGRSGSTVSWAECTLITLVGDMVIGGSTTGTWTLNEKPWNPDATTKHRVGTIFVTATEGDRYIVATRVAYNALVVISEDCGA